MAKKNEDNQQPSTDPQAGTKAPEAAANQQQPPAPNAPAAPAKAGKAKPEPTLSLEVVTPILMSGEHFKPGDKIRCREKQAAQLIEAGAAKQIPDEE